MLYKSSRSSHKEANNISFAFLGFFYDFIWILQDSTQRVKVWTFGFHEQVPRFHS
jgi:hypothetical protein